MRNLVCPVSIDKIYDAIPRILSSQVILLLIIFLIQPIILIPLFLSIDFFLRSIEKGEYSILAALSKGISSYTNYKGVLINKAPKVFAARLGFIFSLLILVSHLLGLQAISFGLTLILGVCAGMELVLNFCLGCYIYTYLILPFYKN